MITIDVVGTGNRIDELRKEAGISVRDIQKVLGFETPAAIYKWLHGDALPKLDNLVILADILGVTIDEIVMVKRLKS